MPIKARAGKALKRATPHSFTGCEAPPREKEIWKNGIAIPVKRVIRDETSVFPIQEYDWDDIRERVNPLVVNVIRKALASTFS